MEIKITQDPIADARTPLLALPIFAGEEGVTGAVAAIDERLDGQISGLRERGDFRGKKDETLLLYPREGSVGAERLLLVGMGKPEELDRERLRRAAGTATKRAAKLRVDRLAFPLIDASTPPPTGDGAGHDPLGAREVARALAEGAVLGSYTFEELKTRTGKKEEEPPAEVSELVLLADGDSDTAEVEAGARLGGVLARAENLARTLGNLPGNIATPTYLAETAERIANEHGMRATILGPEELRAEGMGALLGVAQGSDQEPRLIVLEHRKGTSDEQPLVLLGKGLTFDAGGISIKPAERMEEMKFDMCGGAAVLGAMQAIGELGIERNVVGVVPSSENLLSGSSMKPGDVLTSHLGKTIEIVNTDAEGRLILADALSYLRRFDPVAVVDAATLTGACVIALGNQASGVMGNDENLIEELRAAGDRVGERVWPLPMHEEYREQLKSDYADIKNSGGRPAGTITAGWFLREFVGEFPWAHLDIAGTAWGDGKLPYQIKGGTGVPTRLFVEWVLSRAT